MVPFVLLIALYAKNLARFGHFGPSTWLGMNLARVATASLDPAEIAGLRRQQMVSPMIEIRPFSPPDAYPAEFFDRPRHPDRPALAERRKSTGAVNYNHEAYVAIADRYRDDALALIAARPLDYLQSVAKAGYHFTRPATDIVQLEKRLAPLAGYVRWRDRLLYGGWLRLPIAGGDRTLYLVTVLDIPWLLWTSLRRCRDRRLRYRQRVLLAFLFATAVYVAVVGNTLEVGENQRFRFYVDPFLAAMLGLAADRLRATRWAGAALRRPRP